MKNHIKKVLAVIVLLPAPLITNAQETQRNNTTVAIYTTGELLTKYCRSFLSLSRQNGTASSHQQAYEAGKCSSFIEAIHDGFAIQDLDFKTDILQMPFCTPFSLNSKSLTEVVARYLDDHPEERYLTGYYLTRKALAQKFPC